MDTLRNTILSQRAALRLLGAILLGVGALGLFCALSLSVPKPVTLADPEAAQEQASQTIGSVSAGQTLAQTFVSRRSGLNSITLWLAAGEQPLPPGGSLQIELRHTPQDAWPIFAFSLPFERISGGEVTIHLPPQRDPPGQRYHLLLKTQLGSVRVLGHSEDPYPYGEAYLGTTPLAADMAFRLTYAYDWHALLEDLRAALPRLWLALPLVVALGLPGWLLLESLGLGRLFDVGERGALATALSLALSPLVMLWTGLAHVTWNRQGVLIGGGFLAALAVWRIAAHWRRRPLAEARQGDDALRLWSGGALAAVLAVTLMARFIMARDLSAPAWVDSVHHAVITRLILSQGQIPESYAPYLDFPAYKYHPGFHVGLAVFQWLSGLALEQAMLLYGQVLNALAALAAYLLTTTLVRQRSAALFAALVVGLFTPMPAYYVSWGRYTQLAGLLLVPAVLALMAKAWQSDLRRREGLALEILAGVVFGGLLLMHYRMAAFAVALAAAFAFSQFAVERGAMWQWARRVAGSALVIGLVSAALTLAWLVRMVPNYIAPLVAAPSNGQAKAFADFSWRYLSPAGGAPVTIMASLGLLWGLLHRRRFAVALAVWVGALLVLANLGALGLPGSGMLLNNTTVAIALFLPIAVLAGYVVGELGAIVSGYVRPRQRAATWGLLAAATVIAAASGLRALLPISNPHTALFRQADRAALTWLDKNLPADAVVAINPFLWGYDLYGGSDGGFWIEALSGRRTIPPPVLYGLGSPDERQKVEAYCEAVIQHGSEAQAVWQAAKQAGAQYVFVGERGGPISPHALAQSPYFRTCYAQAGVWIFDALP